MPSTGLLSAILIFMAEKIIIPTASFVVVVAHRTVSMDKILDFTKTLIPKVSSLHIYIYMVLGTVVVFSLIPYR